MALIGGQTQTELFTIRETPGAGRGVFADVDMAAGTTLWRADDLTAHVVLREYRGEVCWECFGYNRGRKLPVRDATHGFTFCSAACAAGFKARYDEVCLQTWAAVYQSSQARAQKAKEGPGPAPAGDETPAKPTGQVINEAWDSAVATAAFIIDVRTAGAKATKAQKRALQLAATRVVPSTDVLTFQTHALLTRYISPSHWAAILSLADEPCPYTTQQELQDHITAYLHLAAIVPPALLPLLATADTLRTAKSREVHNSFGIRSLEDAGSEFFGYGCWPSASFFNHSCRPNVRRRRTGRVWTFEAACEIPSGRQLCISYLNGEEDALDLAERRARLCKTWGFSCACERCGSSQS
ncbi:hypothetical protein BD289DRAFT_371132 [Coniella lustricola]|uniref:SET domain-containing protein n=1 Tax=Coniella lustricola TaxID=2025994 RepID=A0A2T3A469_9PEZI|nr:hypothetical protein BD289DRAFT_371132 [Coniella lustricola]